MFISFVVTAFSIFLFFSRGTNRREGGPVTCHHLPAGHAGETTGLICWWREWKQFPHTSRTRGETNTMGSSLESYVVLSCSLSQWSAIDNFLSVNQRLWTKRGLKSSTTSFTDFSRACSIFWVHDRKIGMAFWLLAAAQTGLYNHFLPVALYKCLLFLLPWWCVPEIFFDGYF